MVRLLSNLAALLLRANCRNTQAFLNPEVLSTRSNAFSTYHHQLHRTTKRLHSQMPLFAASNNSYTDNEFSCGNDQNEYYNDNSRIKRSPSQISSSGRRHFLWMEGLLTASFLMNGGFTSNLLNPPAAHARGMVQFPFRKGFQMMNTYHIMRAGESLLEEENILYTNPLFLTNRDSALSTKGSEQVSTTAQGLLSQHAQNLPSIIMYSLAAHGMDTANVLRDELGIGQSRLLPEYTFLDPRGVGKWDSLPLQETEEAIWALDESEAGKDGKSISDKPPPNDDGTPNETLDNQVTRLWQLMNGLESRYSGETIMLIFPDGTGPSLLLMCMAGLPYHRVHELNFAPGQVQLNVTQYTATEILESRNPAEIALYKDKVNRGAQELKRLQSLDINDIVNIRDQQLIDTQREIAKETEARQAKQLQQKKEEEDAKLARLTEMQQQRQMSSLEASSGTSTIGVIPAVASASVAALAIAGVAASTTSATDSSLSATESPNGNKERQNSTSFVDEDSTDTRRLSQSLSPNFTGSKATLTVPSGEFAVSLHSLDGLEAIMLQEEEKVTMDPEERARLAMEEYLNQDDGQEAWLGFLEDEIAAEEKSNLELKKEQQEKLENEILLDIKRQRQHRQQTEISNSRVAIGTAGMTTNRAGGRNETFYDGSSGDASP